MDSVGRSYMLITSGSQKYFGLTTYFFLCFHSIEAAIHCFAQVCG